MLTLVILANGAMLPLRIGLTQGLIDTGIQLRGLGDIASLAPWVVGLMLCLLFSNMRELMEMLLKIRIQHRLRKSLSPCILHKLASLGYDRFENAETHDLIKRVGSAPEEKATESFWSFLFLPSYFISLIGLASILYSFGWWILLVMAALFGLALRISIRKGLEGYRLNRSQTLRNRQATYLSQLLTGRQEAKEVRLFGLYNYLQNRWRLTYGGIVQEQMDLAIETSIRQGKVQLLRIAFVGGALVAFGIPLVQGKVTVGAFIAVASALQEAFELAAWYMPYSLAMLAQESMYWRDYDDLMTLPEAISPVDCVPVHTFKQGIEFRNVHFTYPGSENEVLRGVNLRIAPGERIALVGANGAGKSTLIKLLLGMYRPQQGEVLVDGNEVWRIHPNSRRRLLSAVFQDFTHYELTVRENIAFGSIEDLDNDQRILQAAHQGMLDELLTQLPDGLDTYLGKVFSQGTDISQGQAQRLALARLHMADTPIVILDEPAASLDPRAETELYHNFDVLSRDKTCILVSHRLGSTRICQRIVVLDGGLVVEVGSHDELLKCGGMYRDMFLAQAEWYDHDEEVTA